MYILKNNVVSSIINIVFIYFGMPLYGVNAFIVGWIISLILTTITSLHRIIKITETKINVLKCFIYPLLCILVSSLTLRLVFINTHSNKISTVIIMSVMCIFYILLLIATGCIKKDEILQFIGFKK